ncbi:uncharacterized protein LOC107405977 [Ziziphus jujuba]|uniref:Uncharacterized protein LOC107405977 n=1 Tax=Ziziphus jujuba TaxID=326968 RepID=A0A6P3Z146_ZIZJJ|nr:uncharacterized protein LOC107405977 [Ziziphus jujuba]XP_048320511.2 uncharacterized protein LOC107405977 [Ziziphus jujuba]XP_048320512.2 uncharacterized protein LOC107405977 [Ziziphus jujuba]
MGLEMKLDFGKNSAVDLSPKTVLPSHQHCSYVGKRNTKGRPRRKDDLLSLKEDFREISFHRYRSTSCKSIPSRSFGQEGKIEVKRGSIYQSSKEVRKIKKLSTIEGRRKIKMLPSSDASISSRIVDSLCNSDKESPQRRSQAMSSNSNSIPSPVSKPCIVPSSSDGFIEICLYPGNRGKNSVESVGSGSMDLSLGSKPVAGPLNNGNELLEREAVHTFHKSLSTKVEMRHSPSPSESDCSSKASSKSRFSPIRKMFDPFIKSKSLRSPLSYALEPGEVKIKGMKNKRVNRTYCKSLLDDFSNNARDPEYKSTLGERDNHQSFFACSPVHLHGFLKLETKHGIPFFEFSLKCPQDVFVAKSWKVNDACNWVYTFHSVDSGKKSSASGWGLFDGDKDSSMVGQMQVSCYLCSELKDGVFDNSMVTEFVLYDIAHARLNVAAQENSSCTLDAVKSSKDSNPGLDRQTLKLDDVTHTSSVKLKQDHATYDGQFNSSNPHPWPTANLHPNLEIAAIIMQVPFEKRESLKYKRGDKGSDKAPKNLLSLSIVEQRKEDLPESRSPEKVKVVIPAGNHGLPSAESRGPSSLLDRWRLGGGCDCGGWDMACPLVVLGNPHFQFADNQPLVENQGPLELFVQGGKEQTPALTMSVVEEGLYAVDFHAQLSTLQAFSICIAILHSTETSSAGQMQERDKQLPHCNSLKVLIEDEVKFLIEAVTAEEKRNVTKRVKEIPASFVLNPPFSPMSRA